MYGQISGSLRFGSASANVNISDSYYRASVNANVGKHSASAEVRTRDLSTADAYSMRASYSYSGDIMSLNASYNAYNSFDNSNLNINLSTSSLFADGLFVVSSYIPSNFLLIRQEGVLNGNEVTVGNIGSSSSRRLTTSFGTAIYPSVSSRGESLSVFSTDPDSFGTTSTFNVSIPASRRTGYVMRISAESKYSLSSVVTLPDGNLWTDGSSPVYSVKESDGIKSIEMTDYYLFTDQDGRFVANDLLPGIYAFDVPYQGSWILYIFSLIGNEDEYGNIMMYEPENAFEITDALPEQYSSLSHLSFREYMTGDEFWNYLYPVAGEDVV